MICFRDFLIDIARKDLDNALRNIKIRYNFTEKINAYENNIQTYFYCCICLLYQLH